MNEQALAPALQQLIDRQEIHDCILRYCSGVDRFDREMLLSVYHPDADRRPRRLCRRRHRVRRLGAGLPRQVPAHAQALRAQPPLRARRRHRPHRDLLAVHRQQPARARHLAAHGPLPRPLRETRRQMGDRGAQMHHRRRWRTRRHPGAGRSPRRLRGHRRRHRATSPTRPTCARSPSRGSRRRCRSENRCFHQAPRRVTILAQVLAESTIFPISAGVHRAAARSISG